MSLLKPSTPNISIPQHPVKKGTTVDILLSFIRDSMPVFRNKYSPAPNISEEQLNQQLTLTLNREVRRLNLPFLFQSEYEDPTFVKKKGKKRNIDIGTISTSTNSDLSFYSIECKRLHRPPSSSEQYVENNRSKGGGIERFKRLLHGQSLDRCAVVAYVQDTSFGFWHKTVNDWISTRKTSSPVNGLDWSKDKKLKYKSCAAETRVFESTHTRTTGNNIILDHIWVRMF